jgi:CRISPR system Cascade subunit CasA
MNLLLDPWIPVRSDEGAGAFRLLTYRELLCHPGNWRVSLPRDDMELACLQLLISMTQVMFLPEDDEELLDRIDDPLTDPEFEAGIAPCADWFDLDHPNQPFMQTRGVQAREVTPIQKLLIGLPEGNNHCFFNEVGEVAALSAPAAAIALFNQAVNCPSFGGGFKGSLRGGAPITTLVDGPDLRQQVWRNVLTRERIQANLPNWDPDLSQDRPTWIDPIKASRAGAERRTGVLRPARYRGRFRLQGLSKREVQFPARRHLAPSPRRVEHFNKEREARVQVRLVYNRCTRLDTPD